MLTIDVKAGGGNRKDTTDRSTQKSAECGQKIRCGGRTRRVEQREHNERYDVIAEVRKIEKYGL